MKICELRQHVSGTVELAFATAFPEQQKRTLTWETPPANIGADFAFPCFPLARLLKRNPARIATTLAEQIRPDRVIAQVETMGPYLNIFLDRANLARTVLEEISADPSRFGHSRTNQAKRILIEYSSPNTNKPLHLGHIRNHVLATAVANLLKAVGYEVKTAVIFNDRGIHICKAMLAYQKYGEGKSPQSTGIKGDHFVGNYYVLFARKEKEEPGLLAEAQDMLRRWEQGDEEIRALWKKMNGWVYEGLEQTYQRMGCSFDLRQYESETYLLGKKVASHGLANKVFTRDTDGSIWIDLEEDGLDRKVLMRADGTSLYITQDLGTAIQRFETLDLDRAIYVVGNEQNYHFQVLFRILEKLGYSWAKNCFHLSYGMVDLPEGKMKSREGTVVDADELLDEMKTLAQEVMAESGLEYEEGEIEQISEIIGQGSVRFFLLKFNPKKTILFDPRASLSFEGMTGAYLLYTHARIASIGRKAGNLIQQTPDYSLLQTNEELNVLRLLFRYPELLNAAAENMNPALLAQHLGTLAQAYNTFYAACPVINAENERLAAARLQLCNAVALTLRSGLALLGNRAPDKM